ncbi:MAG: hypothetical protein A2017_19690 [Lentisphaerae bacterium GWF2_44_16]|nr:MAG: hypothetical protein A2017_19690 [Lentisphaerae bacterium GWF2_44_16]
MKTSKQDTVYDVIILGGGFEGLGAAFTLAEKGKKVLVAESRPSLGWEATWTYNLELQKGISKYADILADEISSSGGTKGNRIDPVLTELSLLKMAKNIEILHYCCPSGFEIENNKVKALIMAGKSGSFYLQAKSYIDATENRITTGFTGEKDSEQPSKHIYSFFMNAVENTENLPEKVNYGNGVLLIKNTPWKGEAAIEFETSRSMYQARLEIPEILKFIRAKVSGMEKAIMTHSANIGLPIYAKNTTNFQSKTENIFYPSRRNATSAQGREALLSERMKSGEEAAALLMKKLDTLSAPAKLDRACPPSVIPEDAEHTDIIVCGGGTAGAVAAIAAGKQGQKTKLIEASVCLGGIGTAGAIHVYYHGVTGGIQDEIDRRVSELDALYAPDKMKRGFHPEVKKTVLLEMALEAGVSIEFESMLTGTETDSVEQHLPAGKSERADRKIKSVITNNLSGVNRHTAEVFIDSTGDADLAALAGCRYSLGRDTDAVPHSYSQPSDSIIEDKSIKENNFDMGYCDPTDPWDMTRARIIGLRHYQNASFADEKRAFALAPLLGLRNSRLIYGKYRMTLADQIKASEFPDVIGYSYCHYDNHALDYENESDEAMIWVWCLGNWHARIGCEIPYRSLLPENIVNLLVACRAMSLEFDAHNQLRMQRDMQRIGEAAGIAAAISCRDKKYPTEIDVKKIQEKLFESGALKNKENNYHWDGWKPENLFALQMKNNLLASGENMTDIVKSAYDLKTLKNKLDSDKAEEKYNAALKLALANDEKARKVLLDCIKERCPIKTEGYKTAEMWKPAMMLAGMLKIKEAIPLLNEVINDETSDQAALIAAMKALARLGEKASAPLIEKMLKRDNLPSIQTFQRSSGHMPVVEENSLWKLELAAVECLSGLGVKRPDIIERYIDNESAVIRRSALRIKEKTGV